MRWCNPCMHVTPFTRNFRPTFWVFGKILPGVSRTRKPEPELLHYATDGCTDTVIHTSPRLVTCYHYLKLHFNRCWYARLSMTSRNCRQTQLLTTCMGPPCPSYLCSVQMTGRILSPPGNDLMKLFRLGFAQTSSSHG